MPRPRPPRPACEAIVEACVGIERPAACPPGDDFCAVVTWDASAADVELHVLPNGATPCGDDDCAGDACGPFHVDAPSPGQLVMTAPGAPFDGEGPPGTFTVAALAVGGGTFIDFAAPELTTGASAVDGELVVLAELREGRVACSDNPHGFGDWDCGDPIPTCN